MKQQSGLRPQRSCADLLARGLLQLDSKLRSLPALRLLGAGRRRRLMTYLCSAPSNTSVNACRISTSMPDMAHAKPIIKMRRTLRTSTIASTTARVGSAVSVSPSAIRQASRHMHHPLMGTSMAASTALRSSEKTSVTTLLLPESKLAVPTARQSSGPLV